ncbi:putative quinol monooxygenase [Sphingobacterium hungaricum]|uniref:Antibiotic biosynthesis monooxygenase n=2 Tax=Sphingobacterium hungaricum TaxID=2082723 RepID=A0A928UXF3_9SPHI|nr:antibiotic biosynthesis monooxygenase [Sphingobacterium hungaricum]
MKVVYLFFLLFISFTMNVLAQSNEQIIRLSEIEIFPEHLEAYNAILKEESEASVRLEKGVIAIFPMYQKENPNQIRIIEIYANQEAYQSHLKTTHFIKYKTSTMEMVKSLKLVDMEAIDPKSMAMIFGKLKE